MKKEGRENCSLVSIVKRRNYVISLKQDRKVEKRRQCLFIRKHMSSRTYMHVRHTFIHTHRQKHSIDGNVHLDTSRPGATRQEESEVMESLDIENRLI